MSDAPLAIEALAVSKHYGDLAALEPLGLVVEHGELVALVGHNGSGKSTFLRMCAGVLEPTGGELFIEGVPAGSIEARAAVSFVPDEPVLYDDLSVREHVEYLSSLHGVDGWPATADELIALLGLADRVDDLPSRFSRGLRQRTSLLVGLVRPFSVLLVDEPFVGLDPRGQSVCVELLAAAAEAGNAVVVTTHQLEFLDHASRSVALRDGELVHDGVVDRSTIDALLA